MQIQISTRSLALLALVIVGSSLAATGIGKVPALASAAYTEAKHQELELEMSADVLATMTPAARRTVIAAALWGGPPAIWRAHKALVRVWWARAVEESERAARPYGGS